MALTKTSNSSSTGVSGGPEDEATTADAVEEGDERVGEAVDSNSVEDAVDPLK